VIYLDTHVLVWLYASGPEKLGDGARDAIEKSEDIYISPMVLLELDYLHEIGRLNVGSTAVYEYLHHHIGLDMCDRSFVAVVGKAATLCWTRDPFDRLIVAQASLGDNTLISRDATIAENYPHLVW